MDYGRILLAVSALILLSYLYEAVSRRWRVPSTLLLLATGVALRILVPPPQFAGAAMAHTIGLVGTVGLILIVLEAGLDLDIGPAKGRIIASALASAFGILLLSTTAVAAILHPSLGGPLRTTLLYAIPLAVVSSAIVLPSVAPLAPRMREFLVYEASFSDILGIMVFNSVAYGGALGARAIALFPLEAALMALAAAVISFGLVVLAGRVQGRLRFSLLIAVVILFYALGKLFHLSALMVVLIAGIVLNNSQLVPLALRRLHLPAADFSPIVAELKPFIAEGSFLLRTFFFTVFGYSLELGALNDLRAIALGCAVVAALVAVRAVALRFVVHVPIIAGCLVIPRGLVTVLLYYSIPANQRSPAFKEGILLCVIVLTNLLSSLGVAASPRGSRCAGTEATRAT